MQSFSLNHSLRIPACSSVKVIALGQRQKVCNGMENGRSGVEFQFSKSLAGILTIRSVLFSLGLNVSSYEKRLLIIHVKQARALICKVLADTLLNG